MERLEEHADGIAGRAPSVLDLLDRLWSMHPESTAEQVLACALNIQVGHLARLPVASGWMMRFLRDLPSFSSPYAAGLPKVAQALDDDVAEMLSLRMSCMRRDAKGIYEDARSICGLALLRMGAGPVCQVVIASYKKVHPDVTSRGE